MRAPWLILCLAAATAADKAPVALPDPKIVSLHPFTGGRGSVFTATARGNGLSDATGVFPRHDALKVTIEASEAEPAGEAGSRSKLPFDLVRLRVEVSGDAEPGRYLLRLVTPRGLSNGLPLHITEHSVQAEPAGTHETPENAAALPSLPAVIAGRLSRRGETDLYAFHAEAGQTLTFEAISGLSSLGAPGGNASGFDPSLTLFEQSGSWFDPSRLKRIAFHDEPLWVIGRPTDAHLSHRFEKAGRYFLRLEAFSGQGGPDYGYQLKILPGEAPQDAAPPPDGWEERSFTRRLSADRLNELAERGGTARSRKAVETYRPGTFQLPATIEGSLAQPGETHRASFHLDGPQDIAIEVETPASAPPLFNPVVRLLDAAGQEVATNIFAGRGACSGDMNKSIQAKTLVPLRDPGGYTIEIRDTTSDLGEPGFQYRVQVRPQVPHIGQVKIDEDRVNLAPGEAKTVRVTFDREEGYRGAVAVVAESLPPGVEALAGADFEPDKDPPRFPGKRERYTPRTERAVVVFTAAADAKPMEQPQVARLLVRPVADGKPGAVAAIKEIPIMVVSKR